VLNWLTRLVAEPSHRRAARSLYAQVVAQARHPAFYEEGGVADSIDGRFDLIVLHAVVIMRRLRGQGEGAARLSQTLFDVMFENLDDNLREMGVGDLTVPKRIKQMSEAFYGRLTAYDAALKAEDPDSEVAGAVMRNVFRSEEAPTAEAKAIAAYFQAEDARLGETPLSAVMEGQVTFGDPLERLRPAA